METAKIALSMAHTCKEASAIPAHRILEASPLEDGRPPKCQPLEGQFGPDVAAKSALAGLSVLHELERLSLVGPQGDCEARGLLSFWRLPTLEHFQQSLQNMQKHQN